MSQATTSCVLCGFPNPVPEVACVECGGVLPDRQADFLDSLSGFVQGFIAANERQRQAEQSLRNLEHEIRWISGEIERTQAALSRRPRMTSKIADLRRQIRRKEIEIAFLAASPETRQPPRQTESVDD